MFDNILEPLTTVQYALDLLIYSSRVRFYEAVDDEGNLILDALGHIIWYDQNDELVTITSFPIATPRNASIKLKYWFISSCKIT